MSSYVSFYLKKDNTWALLADFSRNTRHYEMIENLVKYGELIPLTPVIMSEVCLNIAEELDRLTSSKERSLKEIEIIAGMPNPVEEKLEAICGYNSTIEWADEEIRNRIESRSFYSVISEIIDTGTWLYKTDEYVWAGIEAGPPGEEKEEE